FATAAVAGRALERSPDRGLDGGWQPVAPADRPERGPLLLRVGLQPDQRLADGGRAVARRVARGPAAGPRLAPGERRYGLLFSSSAVVGVGGRCDRPRPADEDAFPDGRPETFDDSVALGSGEGFPGPTIFTDQNIGRQVLRKVGPPCLRNNRRGS